MLLDFKQVIFSVVICSSFLSSDKKCFFFTSNMQGHVVYSKMPPS